MIVPVILSGGSGTRLWPLSTPEKPKQFLPLVSERTMFQETLLRLKAMPNAGEPIVVCSERHGTLVAAQLAEIDVRARAIVLEPEGRNTAPAIGIAAILARESGTESAFADTEPDPILLVLPADHVVLDVSAFRAAVAKAVDAADSGRIVTFGVVPTYAETGYGYIEQGKDEGDWYAVERFVEKPDEETAKSYLRSGRFLWNSGMFAFGARLVLGELECFAPEIHAACRAAASEARDEDGFVRLGPGFLGSPSDSIDYAVVEKTSRAALVPLDAGWSDVGSWAALYDVLADGRPDNVLRGQAIQSHCRGSYIESTSRPLVVLGLTDAIVVETDRGVLVMDRRRAQDVKSALVALNSLNHD